MAKSYKGSGLMRPSDDDIIKQALKEELEHLKASDELIAKTLSRCSAEISRNEKPKSFFIKLMNKPVLRYGATVAAACLLVLVFLVNFPGLVGLSPAKDMSEAPLAKNAAGGADMARSAAVSDRAPASKEEGQQKMQAAPSMDTAPPIPAPETSSDDISIMFTGPVHIAALNSLDSGWGVSGYDGGESFESVDILVASYNKALGTDYAPGADNLITVYALQSGGVDAETLKSASGYEELLGGGSYRILPLKEQSGDYAAVLPVFAKPYDGSIPEEKAHYVLTEGSLMTYSAPALPVDKEVVDAMLSPARLENALKDDNGFAQIAGMIFADINYGSDFIAFVSADGKKYAVPLFTNLRVNSLQNGKAYELRFALDSLARYLEIGE